MTSTPTISFELNRADLRARRNAKWSQYGPDVLPAFVADMDFSVAAPIQTAIERIVRDRDYGYPMREGNKAELIVAKSFARRMKALYDWDLSPDLVLPVADLVQGTYAPILAFSDPGDSIILQVPSYPPFRDAINGTERRLLPLPMRDDGTRYAFDMSELETLVEEGTRIFVLCNPQNPTGRVFRRDELLSLAQFAIAHDLIVISDEIHSDLVYPGQQHVPFASLGSEIASRTITLNSATKSFNIPGLRCALIAFGSEDLRERFEKRIPLRLAGQGNIIGVDATVAAWNECQPWLDAVMDHLLKARNRIKAVLKAEVPEIHLHAPEATYLAWLDCSKLKLSTSAFQFFLDKARIGFSPGESFDPNCASFVRFNFATSTPILDEILDRIIIAARQSDS
ncbi:MULTISPECIES: MalY/PatB family protein [Bradyrhizobium]|uniref:cysteine-S-conjugate beta-lyase n=2 Tax=Bradyrhizobium TaxID=374 RepID=A0ABY0PEA1_9BRAD|nr:MULTISPECIES: PatB family C-S lyase [Bradyrhizobium]SDI20336.1 cystathione beta-lyase [Bradyrhizobium ottawaense]SED74323.1 cystathione beta-lyase [Bradyrhizobium lablabi]SHL69965.1 cystathione beta-lyase [Bradyrhizobium lablabi]